MSRIAVCLSGQPRTIKYCTESILDYFGEVDYFCHVWDYNDYKVKNKETGKVEWKREKVDIDEINSDIDKFKPLSRMIGSVTDLGDKRFGWDSLLFSHLMSINMKKQWEIKHDFRYDWVIKSRYDLVYNYGKKFKISDRAKIQGEYYSNLDLFTAHTGRMHHEFSQINISDVSYYGSSEAMDVAADLYWYVQRTYFSSPDEIKLLGPGTWMSNYIATNNLRFFNDLENLKETIFRTTSIGLNVQFDWDKIVANHAEIYK